MNDQAMGDLKGAEQIFEQAYRTRHGRQSGPGYYIAGSDPQRGMTRPRIRFSRRRR